MVNYLRIGHDVCHTLRTKFPHISTSKYGTFVKKMEIKHYETYQRAKIDDIIGENFDLTRIDKSEVPFYTIFRKFKQLYKKMTAYRGGECVYYNDTLKDLQKILSILKQQKMGNCEEEARVIEFLLKKRGINNACTASIYNGKDFLDHVVTVFNIDGSSFNGTIINNKTVIVDSWTGIVDLANNYFKKNGDWLAAIFGTKNAKNWSLENPISTRLSSQDIEHLTKDFLA